MDFYHYYKPLRNRIRRLPLEESLLFARELMLDAERLKTLRYGTIRKEPLGIRRPITFPWIVDLLIRELVLEAAQHRGSGKTLFDWPTLAETLNSVRATQDSSFVADGPPMDIMVEMHRISHHQFHWQTGITQNSYTRAMRIFGDPAVDALLTQTYGMTVEQTVLMAITLYFLFQDGPFFENHSQFEALGIPAEAISRCFERLSISIPQLVGTPLIKIDGGRADRWFCPVPRYLVNRMTSGLFFDLGRIKNFENPYGQAFSKYVGDVLSRVAGDGGFELISEQRFLVDGDSKDGPDWIWCDASGVLFIEAKTRRMTIKAKADGTGDALDQQVDVLAEAVVQNYQNLCLGLEGHIPHWQPDGRPVFPIIVTIEEWHLLGSRAQQRIDDTVRRRLVEVGLDPGMCDRQPLCRTN